MDHRFRKSAPAVGKEVWAAVVREASLCEKRLEPGVTANRALTSRRPTEVKLGGSEAASSLTAEVGE